MTPSTIQLPTLATPVRAAEFFENRPAVMVASHPRSGTHFLMNALANCYGYVASPWINFDHDTANINYLQPESVGNYLMALAARPIATIVKSHHSADFFKGQLERLGGRWLVLVPIRHPVDTLVSYWRFLNSLTWFEGPQLAEATTFFQAEPCGALLRWQRRQFPNMMLRWAHATESWLAAAKESPRVVVVRYEELSTKFEYVMRGFASALGRQSQSIVRPERETSEWLHAQSFGRGREPDREELRALCRQVIAPTMDRLGYD